MISLEPPRSVASEADPWGALGLSKAGLTRFLGRAQVLAELHGNVDVLLSDDRTLRRLNREFRGKNKATDVLSFPAPPEVAEQHAGDLAVSLETAERQAAEHGLTLRDEVRILLLHGVLHLAGFDHEMDDGEMAAEESLLRRKLRLPVGLIARVEGLPASFKVKTSQVKAAGGPSAAKKAGLKRAARKGAR